MSTRLCSEKRHCLTQSHVPEYRQGLCSDLDYSAPPDQLEERARRRLEEEVDAYRDAKSRVSSVAPIIKEAPFALAQDLPPSERPLLAANPHDWLVYNKVEVIKEVIKEGSSDETLLAAKEMAEFAYMEVPGSYLNPSPLP